MRSTATYRRVELSVPFRASTTLLVCLFLALGATACGGGATEPSPALGGAPEGAPEAALVSFTVSLAIEPNPPQAGPVNITVWVKDAQGNPVEGAIVNLTTGMAGMSHGGMRGQLAEAGGGTYQGRGSFSMRGLWRLTVSATKSGASSEQTFEVDVW